MATTFLQTFLPGGDAKRFLEEIPPETRISRKNCDDIEQSIVFDVDLQRQFRALSANTKYELFYLAQRVAIIVVSPFALFIDIFRFCSDEEVTFSTILKNIYIVPLRIIVSIYSIGLSLVRILNKSVSTLSISVGHLAWHGGEKVVQHINGSADTVLSNYSRIRWIVYESLGLTILAAGAVFIPILPIQLLALPIILGSIYGTINNQFTVRNCPEYYTMGHIYDGTSLNRHAIKTNNLLIKPIVTGCYATTVVTKTAGVVLASVGTIPFTAAVLTVQFAAAMIGVITLVSLVAAHIFSQWSKDYMEQSILEFGELIGIQWTEQNENMTCKELLDKGKKILSNKNLNPDSKEKLQALINYIESVVSNENLPIKYMAAWHANNMRNTVGYFFAGGGTLVLSISTIFLRIFAL